MKTAADSSFDDAHPLVARARSLALKWVLPFRYSLASGALIVISFCPGYDCIKRYQDANTAFTDIATFLINGLVTLALLYGAIISYFYGKRVYSAGLILAVATFSFTIGDAI